MYYTFQPCGNVPIFVLKLKIRSALLVLLLKARERELHAKIEEIDVLILVLSSGACTAENVTRLGYTGMSVHGRTINGYIAEGTNVALQCRDGKTSLFKNIND